MCVTELCPLCAHRAFFTCSSQGCSGCCQTLGVGNAALNMGLGASFQISVFGAFFSYTQAWSSWIGWKFSLHPAQPCAGALLCTPAAASVAGSFWGGRSDRAAVALTVLLICISLMTSRAEHLFIRLPAVYVSALEKEEDEAKYDFDGDGEVNNKDVVALFSAVSSK